MVQSWHYTCSQAPVFPSHTVVPYRLNHSLACGLAWYRDFPAPRERRETQLSHHLHLNKCCWSSFWPAGKEILTCETSAILKQAVFSSVALEQATEATQFFKQSSKLQIHMTGYPKRLWPDVNLCFNSILEKTHGDQTPAIGYQGEWKPEAAGEGTRCSQTDLLKWSRVFGSITPGQT